MTCPKGKVLWKHGRFLIFFHRWDSIPVGNTHFCAKPKTRSEAAWLGTPGEEWQSLSKFLTPDNTCCWPVAPGRVSWVKHLQHPIKSDRPVLDMWAGGSGLNYLAWHRELNWDPSKDLSKDITAVQQLCTCLYPQLFSLMPTSHSKHVYVCINK